MSGFQTIQHLLTLLQHRGLMCDFAQYLPTLHFVNRIIAQINAGETEQATAALNRCERVLILLWDELCSDEIEWYAGVIDQVKQHVLPVCTGQAFDETA
ncbi:MAG: hypothetical protein GYB65_14890 [Chloroflexi bacterium]|nr:hypothetical protein [Chloroflexota bacterium]